VKRHLLCVFLLISATACHRPDRRGFEGVERASKAIQDAIDTKATLPRYRELLDTYSTELSGAQQRADASRERAVLSEYEAALKGLTDIRLVWEAKDARGSEMLPIRDDLPARIAREYDLGVNTNEPPSIYADEAMHTIWEAARRHLRAARQALGYGL
jgi:hypothetical protein